MDELKAAAEIIAAKITNRSAKIAVIGVGYVGWELCSAFRRAGFNVCGYDPSNQRCAELDAHHGAAALGIVVDTDTQILVGADVFIIAVPTPLDRVGGPDMSCVWQAAGLVKAYARLGCAVVLESTVTPGATMRVSRLVGVYPAFYLYSPERINPGDTRNNLYNTPKLVAALSGYADGGTQLSQNVGELLYGTIVENVVRCGSADIAEAAKLLENTYRLVNIALVNQLKPVFDDYGIDLHAVIAAASTKPFGFAPFWPSAGAGGHCIPVDPCYLLQWAREAGIDLPIVKEAIRENEETAKHVANIVMRCIQDGRPSRVVVDMADKCVLVVGVTYKRNVKDCRESPAFRVAKYLHAARMGVLYHDPLMGERVEGDGWSQQNFKLSASLIAAADAVLICCNNTGTDLPILLKNAKVIIDTCKCVDGTNVVHA